MSKEANSVAKNNGTPPAGADSSATMLESVSVQDEEYSSAAVEWMERSEFALPAAGAARKKKARSESRVRRGRNAAPALPSPSKSGGRAHAGGESPAWRGAKNAAVLGRRKVPGSAYWTEYRGVSRLPTSSSSCRYGARIWDPSTRRKSCLGTFATADEAARAYDAAAVRLYGARARLNFAQPDGGDGAPALPSPSKELRPSVGASEVEETARKIRLKQAPATEADAGRKKAAGPETSTSFVGARRRPRGGYEAQTRGRPRTRSPTGISSCPPSTAPAPDSTNKAPTQPSPPPAQGIADDLFGEPDPIYGDFNDFPELPPLEFLSGSVLPVLQLDDFGINLSLAGWQ